MSDSSSNKFLSNKTSSRINKLYKIFLILFSIALGLMLWIGNVLVEHKSYIDTSMKPGHFELCMRMYYLGQQVLNWTYLGIFVIGLCAVPYVVIYLRNEKK